MNSFLPPNATVCKLAYEMLLVEVNDTVAAVKAPCKRADVGDMILFDGVQLGKVIRKAFICDQATEDLITTALPTYDAEEIFVSSWKREETDGNEE